MAINREHRPPGVRLVAFGDRVDAPNSRFGGVGGVGLQFPAVDVRLNESRFVGVLVPYGVKDQVTGNRDRFVRLPYFTAGADPPARKNAGGRRKQTCGQGVLRAFGKPYVVHISAKAAVFIKVHRCRNA